MKYIEEMKKGKSFVYLDVEEQNEKLQFCPLINRKCDPKCVCLSVKLKKDPNYSENGLFRVEQLGCGNKMFFNGVDNDFLNTMVVFLLNSEDQKEYIEVFNSFYRYNYKK